jgi:uncharacterized membrane protein
MLKIAGMLVLFGLDWIYNKIMTAMGILCLLILAVAWLIIFRS